MCLFLPKSTMRSSFSNKVLASGIPIMWYSSLVFRSSVREWPGDRACGRRHPAVEHRQGAQRRAQARPARPGHAASIRAARCHRARVGGARDACARDRCEVRARSVNGRALVPSDRRRAAQARAGADRAQAQPARLRTGAPAAHCHALVAGLMLRRDRSERSPRCLLGTEMIASCSMR